MNITDTFMAYAKLPRDRFKEDMQEIVNQGFDVATNTHIVQEETEVGSFKFEDVEVHISHMIDTATGQYKNGDWQKLTFKDLDHPQLRGRYYFFDDCYWIMTYTDKFNNIDPSATVRRCNNWLEWDGLKYPCIIDYATTSSTPLTSETLPTPNSNITIIVQANDDTLKIDLNQKFMIGNKIKKRPYRVINYGDYLHNSAFDNDVPLLYLTLALVQKSSQDEIEEEVKPVIGDIVIEPEIKEILLGKSTTIVASVEGAESPILCEPSGASPDCYDFMNNGDNTFTITNKKQTSTPLKLTFTCEDKVKEMEIKLRARF